MNMLVIQSLSLVLVDFSLSYACGNIFYEFDIKFIADDEDNDDDDDDNDGAKQFPFRHDLQQRCFILHSNHIGNIDLCSKRKKITKLSAQHEQKKKTRKHSIRKRQKMFHSEARPKQMKNKKVHFITNIVIRWIDLHWFIKTHTVIWANKKEHTHNGCVYNLIAPFKIRSMCLRFWKYFIRHSCDHNNQSSTCAH